LTGSCWEDSQRNSGSDCLFRFILTALVLLKRCLGLSIPIQTNTDGHQTNAVRHQTMCQDSASKQYFGHCATISSRILTGSCWEDSQRNSGSDCLFRFILTALVLLKRCLGLSIPIQTNTDSHQTNAVRHQTMCQDSASKQYFGHCATISSRILTGSCWEDSQRNSGSDCLFRFILTALALIRTRMLVQTRQLNIWPALIIRVTDDLNEEVKY
jgi:hypothetical protein